MFSKYIVVLVLVATGYVLSHDCPVNEVYNSCGPMCDKMCDDQQNEICIEFDFCISRCYCRADYARDSAGICIPKSECSPSTEIKKTTTTPIPTPSTPTTTTTTAKPPPTTPISVNMTTVIPPINVTTTLKPIPNCDYTIIEWVEEVVDDIVVYIYNCVQTVVDYCFD